MKLRTTLAGLSAAAIALSGLILGGTAANAAPGDVHFVPSPIVTTTPAEETAEYNNWHFSPNLGVATSQPNGQFVAAGASSQWIVGNGNDGSDPAVPVDAGSIEALAGSMHVVTSNETDVYFQIPVFYGHTSAGWKFTTLRQDVANGTDVWTTSSAIAGSAYGAGASADIADLVAALDVNNDARAIAAGVLVSNASVDTVVSSIGFNGETTFFYAAPTIDPLKPVVSEFVHSDNINPDESTYEGWHQGVATTPGTFASLDAANGAVNGLQVNGRSQILYGYAAADYSNNNLPEILTAGASVFGVPSDDIVGYTFQVPVFFYVDGVVGQKYTTLRVDVPPTGVISASDTWTTSGAIGSAIPADSSGDLLDMLGSMSSYQVIGHGFYLDSGIVTAESVTFNGRTTNFTKAAVVPAAPKGPQPIANTGAVENMAPMIGIAALALLTLGGVTLAARRRLQQD